MKMTLAFLFAALMAVAPSSATVGAPRSATTGDTLTVPPGATFRVSGPPGAKWSSTNVRVVTVNPSGQAKAVAVGQAYLKAVVDRTVADSVLIIVKNLTAPTAIASISVATHGVSGTAYSATATWPSPGNTTTYRWTFTVGSNTDTGTVGTTTVTVFAGRQAYPSIPQLCVVPVNVSSVVGPSTCALVPVPLADSVSVRLFAATDTAFNQGVMGTTIGIGDSRLACAYAWTQGRVITNPTVTWAVGDTTVATFTPSDSASYATSCLAKLSASLLWPLP